jgi:histidine triad (HIT) family protein
MEVLGDGPMTDEVTASDCFVCRMHRDDSLIPGGTVWMDDLVVVSHLSPQVPGGADSVYLGHLLMEPRRHAPGLAGLSNAEAQAFLPGLKDFYRTAAQNGHAAIFTVDQ